jgi:T5SS/PEP-CTERM-associated repeat protein
MASVWRWTGSVSNDPTNPANWLLVAGSGNAAGIPATGDSATVDSGGLIAGSSTTLAASSLANDGTIRSLGGAGGYSLTLEIAGGLSGTGTLSLGNGSIMKLDGAVPVTQTVAFDPAGAAILIFAAPPATIAAPIGGLNVGDRIEFGGVSNISNVVVGANGDGSDTITVTTDIGPIVLGDVRFAAGANEGFEWYRDGGSGFWQIQVAPQNISWTGASTTDLGTGGNWAPSTAPAATQAISFSDNAGGALTGSAVALTAAFHGTGTWDLRGTLTLAAAPNPPYLPNVFFSNAASLIVDGGAVSGPGGGNVGLAGGGGATLTIQNGGTVSLWSLAVGNGAGEAGHLLVTGAGSSLTNLTGSAVTGPAGYLVVAQAGTADATITNHASVTDAGSDTVGVQTGAVGVLTVAAGGSLTDAGLTIGASGTGTLDVNAGGTVTSAGTFLVGNNAGSDGTVTVDAGGALTLDGGPITTYDALIIGLHGADTVGGAAAAHGAVVIDGGSVDLGQNGLAIGGSTGGTGELTVSAGGSLTAVSTAYTTLAALAFGDHAGSVATVTLTDAGTRVDATGYVVVGRGGQATMTVENGAVLTDVDIPGSLGGIGIGDGFSGGPNATLSDIGGSGNVTVTAGGLIDVHSTTSYLTVGGNGADGALVVSAGGVVQTGDRFVVGTATAAGGVVYGGTGTVTIGAGGTIRVTAPQSSGTSPAMVIGGANSSVGGTTTEASGSVTVTGAGALLDTGGYSLAVGNLSLGTLTVSNAGVVDAGNTVIAGSSAGSLSIASGGAVDVAGTFAVGVSAGASGVVTVADVSTLTASGDITIGEAGAATLTVGTGATVRSTGGGVTIGATGTLTLTGGTIDPPATVTNDGTINGSGTLDGALVNDGTVTAGGGTGSAVLDVTGGVTGTGAFAIATGGILEFDAAVGGGQTVNFLDTTGRLDIEALAGFQAAISGFRPNGVIHVAGVDGGSLSGTTLTLTHGGSVVGTLSLAGVGGAAINPSDIVVTAAGDVMACFAEGVRILTERGEVPVEALEEGDVVLARFAGPSPVRWIGRRAVACARHPDPSKVHPVLIRAGAFGADRPCRDLRVSPDHAVYLPEARVLVPAKHLVNGASIVQVAVDAITYFHVELDAHDVLLSDGLPTESLLPGGDRSMFENGGPPVRLHPDFHALAWAAEGCAPLVVTGPALDAARARLRARAALAERPCLTVS